MKPKNPVQAALSGILLGQTTIAHGLPLLHGFIFLGFIPLWSAWLRESRWKRIFLTGWLAQFALTLIAFNWVAHTVTEFGRLPLFVSALVLLVYCSLANLHIPLAGVIWHFLFRNRSRNIRIASLALVMALSERFYPMIFEWHFGYAWFFKEWPGMQLADLVGFSGLSSFTILLNGIFLLAFENAREKRSWWKPLISGLACIGMANALGVWRASQVPSPDAEARILLVQANIGNRLRHQAEHGENFQREILKKYLQVTERGLKENPHFALWPETAFPQYLLENGHVDDSSRRLEGFLQEKGLRLATGSYGFNLEGQTINGLFFFGPGGKWEDPPYGKTVLLAFGEFIPGAAWFPRLKEWFPAVRDFGRGSGPRAVDYAGLKIGPQICYEGLFDWFSRGLAQEGAEILVNVTNDSWYGTWQQPFQHFTMTLARSVETRLPLVRATNTGISGAVSARGEVLLRSPIGEEWSEVVSVPYRKNPASTPFVRFGWWLVPLLLLLSLVFCLIQRKRLTSFGPSSRGSNE